MSPLHVRSKVYIAHFHVRSKVCIAPFFMRSKVCIFAPHLDGSIAAFAPHMERSHSDFAPHVERRHNFRDQKIAISANFVGKVLHITYIWGVIWPIWPLLIIKIFWGKVPLRPKFWEKYKKTLRKQKLHLLWFGPDESKIIYM